MREGVRSHGYVTGVQDYGVFVGFYSDVKGLVPSSELMLEPGQTPASVFEPGQVKIILICTLLGFRG